MYFNKIRHPSNFAFARFDQKHSTLVCGKRRHSLSVEHIGSDAYRLRVRSPEGWVNPSQAELAASLPGSASHRLEWSAKHGLALLDRSGREVLRGLPGATFGTCGKAWMLQWTHRPGMEFYGLGEHSRNFEKTGQRVKFWNTDLWGDFSLHEVQTGTPNPMYVAIPWVIVKQGNTFVGLLVNHPGAVFMDLASNFIWEANNPDDKRRGSFFVGAPDGEADVYVIVGPDLPALVEKLQTLVGRTPRPPLWALGHHQCRWGYASPGHLHDLDEAFTKHGIPTDGLWLDIDYMDRYKVFTFDPKLWGGKERIRREMTRLARNGRRVIPILDPGVKVEPGYAVCDEGLKSGVFCLNPEGLPYVGFVWPGQTYLPDFSLAGAREWWARHVAEFAGLGPAGAWLDMNDPSVGAVELDDMLFDRGRRPHEDYHNQYALGMAKASHAGFLAARPGERPFLLARSAFISSSRYTAVWTGDNCSNWHHLRNSIPLSLGLALSGQPFNGPDVGGFGGDTTPELTSAWYQAGFLFPFLRNHSLVGTIHQEPWALSGRALRTIRHFIRLRYKMLPYLYQLFIAQEETGRAILRPLFHDFADSKRLPLGKIADQFLVGPSIMQAPILEPGKRSRPVVLPGDREWYAAHEGRWIGGGATVKTSVSGFATPLYVREGALIPMQVGTRKSAQNSLDEIELHCFLKRSTRGVHRTVYVADDGLTFAYRDGQRSAVEFSARVRADGSLLLEVERAEFGWKPIKIRIVAYDRFSKIVLRNRGEKDLATRKLTWNFVAKQVSATATRSAVEIGVP